MRIIPIPAANRQPARRPRHRVRTGLLLLAALFLLANLVAAIVFHNRTYPNTSVAGHRIGSVASGNLEATVRKLPLLPKSVTLADARDSTRLDLASLHISPDYRTIARQAMEQRSWLPLANILTAHDVPAALAVDQTALQQAVSGSLTGFNHGPADAAIERKDGSFAIKPDDAGVNADATATSQRLVTALQAGKSRVDVATQPVGAKVKASDLKQRLDDLQAGSHTAVSLRHGGKTKKFDASDIAGWYSDPAGSTALSDTAIRGAISAAGATMGVSVSNLDAATAAVTKAVQEHKALIYDLATRPAAKTVTYCVALRGVSDSELPALAERLQQTYDDARGWSLGGLVAFKQVDAGCDLTVWLAAADQMPSFGAICDSEWSCTVHPYVIINYDRWRYTSDAWKKSGGSLDEYRAMAINHETGHWFGFNHAFCPGAGQLAPVMQQQSINLQGCSFNAWPTAGEQAALRQQLGL